MLSKGSELGGEDERISGPAEVQRLDPESIPDQAENPLTAIPQSEREHPVEFPDRALHTPFLEGAQNHLGVAVAEELVTAKLKIVLQLAIVVHFAIVGHYVAAAGRDHGLMTRS